MQNLFMRRRMIAAAAVLIAAFILTCSLVVRWETLHTVSVDTAAVEYRDITGHVICYGELEYGTNYGLYAQKPIRPGQWYVKPGTMVSAGEKLLTGGELSGITLQDGMRLMDKEGILAVFSSLTGQDGGIRTTDTRQLTMLESSAGCELVSPVDGIVTQITDLSAVPAQVSLLTVADPESIRMRAQLPEEYVQDIAAGMPCVITGSAFRDREYHGEIAEIAPFAYNEFSLSGDGERVVDLMISIKDADGAVCAGYSAEAKIENYLVKDALFIPYDAVMQDENNVEYVWVIHRGRSYRRDIKTGQIFDGIVEVVCGLEMGELVVCNPEISFYDGMPVRQGRADAEK